MKRGYLRAKASQLLRSWPTSRPRVNGILATVCLGVLGFFLYVTYRHGEDSYVRIHDNLDLMISWYKVLKDSRTFWAPLDATVPQIFNGLPRNSMVSSLIIFPSFFMFLDTLHAYILTEVIARLTGYVGMLLLLRKHVLGEEQNPISHFVALVFSLVPLTHSFYLTIMGQPLLLYAFLNLRQRRNSIHSWLILGLFPFCSSLVVGGFAIVIGMAGFVIWDWIHKRKLNFHLMWAVALVTLCYAIVEYRLVYQSFFDSGYVSHRTAWAPRGTPYHDILPEMLMYFARGRQKIETLQLPVVVAVPLCVAWRMILLQRRGRFCNRHRDGGIRYLGLDSQEEAQFPLDVGRGVGHAVLCHSRVSPRLSEFFRQRLCFPPHCMGTTWNAIPRHPAGNAHVLCSRAAKD